MLGLARPLAPEPVPIAEAGGRVTAEDVYARIDLPPFASSAMDGFAVRAADLPGTLRIGGESAAGRSFDEELEPGCAVAISTGAVVPAGADAVVPIENVVRSDNGVEILAACRARRAHPSPGRRCCRRRAGGSRRCDAHPGTPRGRRGLRDRRAPVRAPAACRRARDRHRARRSRRGAEAGPDLRDERAHALRCAGRGRRRGSGRASCSG